MNNLNSKLVYGISLAVFGTLGLFTRYIPLSSGELAMYRAVLATILLTVYMVISNQKIDFSAVKKEIPLLFISGMAMGINWVLLFQAYSYTTVSVATLSYYFAPVIVTVVCPFLFKEKMTAKQVICFAMSTIGLAMIIGVGETDKSGNNLIGIAFGLGAAVFYATVVLINKFIKGVTGIHRTFFQFIAAIVVLVPYVFCTGGTDLTMLTGIGVGSLLIVGLVHTGVNYCLYFTSLKELKGHESAILSYIDPLVAVLVSVLILGEKMTIMQVTGGILILGFTLWNEIGKNRK